MRRFLPKFSDFLPNFCPLPLFKTIGNPERGKTIGEKEGIEFQSKDTNNIIPSYLIFNNQKFQQFIACIPSINTSSFTANNIQEIAILMRQIEINKLEKSLWEMYLQSGTGELGYTINRSSTILTSALCVWPLAVRKAIFKKNKDIKLREEQLKQNDENQITTIYQINNETCRTYTVDFISELNKRLKKCYFKNLFTTQIEEMILKYIEEQEISFLRIENKTKLTIVQYDYKDKIIQAEFDQVKPSDCQVRT